MLDRRSSDREAQRLGFRVEPDTFVFALADSLAPPPGDDAEALSVRRVVLGRDAVTIPSASPVFDDDPGRDGGDPLDDTALEAFREDGFLGLSRLTAIGADMVGPF